MTAKERKTNENKRAGKVQKSKLKLVPLDRKAFEQISLNESVTRLSRPSGKLPISVNNQTALKRKSEIKLGHQVAKKTQTQAISNLTALKTCPSLLTYPTLLRKIIPFLTIEDVVKKLLCCTKRFRKGELR